jgi:hypothetical protein
MISAFYAAYTAATIAYWRDFTVSYNQAAIAALIIMLGLTANMMVG